MCRGVSARIREVMGASRVALRRLPARLQSLLMPGRQGGGTRQGELPRLPDELPQPDEPDRRHLAGWSDHCKSATVRQRWVVRADIRGSRPASGAGDVPARAGVVPVLAVAARLAFAPSGGETRCAGWPRPRSPHSPARSWRLRRSGWWCHRARTRRAGLRPPTAPLGGLTPGEADPLVTPASQPVTHQLSPSQPP
jgi:hypothetical protein